MVNSMLLLLGRENDARGFHDVQGKQQAWVCEEAFFQVSVSQYKHL